MPPFNLSPSKLSRFFYHECERYLRYHATPAQERESAGIPEIKWDISPVTDAILEGGYAWEEEVIRKKLKKRAKIARGRGKLYERTHSIKNSINVLKKLKPNEAIYQPTLQVPTSFYKQYNLSPDLCEFPPCRPDLIQLVEDEDAGICLRIIDIKASSTLKASHRIQVTLYAIMLQSIIEDLNLNLPLDTKTGGIWLFGQDRPESFELRFSTGTIKQFLEQRLNQVLTMPIAEVPWHLFFRCEWCEFFDSCRQEAETDSSVSLLPYLSVGGRKYLRDTKIGRGNQVNSMREFRALLKKESADDILDACGSLRGKKERLLNSVRSLQQGEVIPHGGSSLALPVAENISLAITLQNDPVSGMIYAAGFRRLKGKPIYGTGSHEEIFVAESPENCEDIQRDFLTALFEELSILDKYNRKKTWREQKSLQAYVFDSYELTLFNQFLQESAKDAELAPMALQMLFYFQDPALADEEEHPANEIPFPVIVLTSVIRQLLALPIQISFRLPEVVQMLPTPNFAYRIEPSDLFWFELSNTLKSDAIFNVWHKDMEEQIGLICDEIKRRLIAANAVADGLRHRVKDKLFAWPAKFSFPGVLNFHHNELSRLAFIQRYESFMGATNQRESRTKPWQERVRSAVSIPLTLMGGNRWEVDSKVDSSLIDDTGGFLNFILVPNTESGERAQMSYDDYRNRKTMHAPKGEVRLAGITGRDTDNKTGFITCFYLRVTQSREQKPFRKGNKAVLHARFTDFTSDRIIGRLGELDIRHNSDFLNLIKDPVGFAGRKTRIKKNALNIANDFAGFTRSQARTFQQFMEKRLTLVWGPPGTGKTHFLAKAILCVARAGKEDGKRVRIAVTAFTHAAIENLMEEIRQNMAAFGLQSSMSLYKLKEPSTPRGEKLEGISENSLHYKMGEDILVVGGTVFSFNKAEVDEKFPILVVDEASQMKFGELALGMKPLLSKTGKIVLAGDDLQLPPITRGAYPDPEDGLPGLHESVFAYLRARDSQKNPYTFQLQENWRMNDTLSAFPARTLYGEAYKPINRKLAKLSIKMKSSKTKIKKSTEHDIARWITDPKWPLTVCVLENVQATMENRIEAKLVAIVSETLRKNLLRPGMKTPFPNNAKGDKEFWRKGLFIVSPHHAQIRAIRKALSSQRKWHTSPFVDTVDKMQGQQCQSVIVSYGVSDAETALAEANFIYSLNRLNVSVTRAKAKCIVFLPRPLLEPSFDLLSNENAVKGLGHMHSMIEYCRKYGKEKVFDLDFMDSSGQLKVVRAKYR